MFRVISKNADRYLRSGRFILFSNFRLIDSTNVNHCRGIFTLKSSRSNLCNVRFEIQFQPSRKFIKRAKHVWEHSDSGVNKKYLLWAVYGSFFVGLMLFLGIAITHVKRRQKGIEDLRMSTGRKIKHLIQYRGVILPKFTENMLDKLEDFEVRPDDVWVVSYPRSGTTWAQEIVYLVSSDLDVEKARTTSIDDRFPYLEYMTPGIAAIDQNPSPRLIKTHMPLKLLPKDLNKAKVLYIARNPKDLAVSYYHFCKLLKVYDGPFDEFLGLFVHNRVGYSPWWQHVLDFWNIRDDPNVLFMTYEDMCQDLEESVRKIAAHLGKTLTDKEVKFIAHHCSFNEMKNNEQVNYEWMRNLGLWDNKDSENTFLRKGKIGEWRKYFDEETNFSINRMIAFKLKGSGLDFKYDKEQKDYQQPIEKDTT